MNLLFELILGFWIIIPAYAANGFAPLARGRRRIDFGKKFLDRREIFGPGKTWEGLFLALISGTLFGTLEIYLYPTLSSIAFEAGLNLPELSFLSVFFVALGAMIGDMAGSFIKRRIGMKRGAPAPLLDQAEGVGELERAFANATTKGLATQWYDFSYGWISRDQRQCRIIERLRGIADRWLTWDRSPDAEGIAEVVDEDTPACYLSHEMQAMYWLVFRQKAIFERVGAPWNIYLLDDVVEERVPKFRSYFFLNCFHMTDAERDYINTELKISLPISNSNCFALQFFFPVAQRLQNVRPPWVRFSSSA